MAQPKDRNALFDQMLRRTLDRYPVTLAYLGRQGAPGVRPNHPDDRRRHDLRGREEAPPAGAARARLGLPPQSLDDNARNKQAC